ncbi:hypothetical protein [Atlantibacter hermannii]|uniref:hypothetical protein n=1 Tax=Atlantibacter hermannii TaxID=565 RepID=UPI001F5E7202|nr:hypothetical protein [Atlantibacter hermannii]
MEINNKHLVDSGREFASKIDIHTAIIDIVRMMADLTEALDAEIKRSEALAVENAALKTFGDKLSEMHNDLNGEGTGIQGRAEVACQQVALEAAMEEFDAIKTPATDAFLAEVRAQGVELVADHLETLRPNLTFSPNSIRDYAAQIRKGMFDDELRGNSNGGAL